MMENLLPEHSRGLSYEEIALIFQCNLALVPQLLREYLDEKLSPERQQYVEELDSEIRLALHAAALIEKNFAATENWDAALHTDTNL